MNLILPIGGKSTRYPNCRPKWLLTHPNGNFMLTEAIRGLPLPQFNNIIIIANPEHEKQYHFSDALKEELKEVYNLNKVIILCLFDDNQPHGVYLGIKNANLDLNEGIFIKDCDNYFKIDNITPEHNFVAVSDLHDNQELIAGNKSYVKLGSSNSIVNIIEKQVISNLFCCGGYYFKSAQNFIKTYEELQDNKQLYLSHIIYKQILDGELFFTNKATNYVDWGTLEDWNKFKSQYKVLFVDIDGVIVKNSAKRLKPTWGTTEALKKNVKILNELYATKKCQIILTTSRSDEYREKTIKQLETIGLNCNNLIMGLFHGQRILINDYAPSNGYPSAIAINLERNSDKLKDLL